MTKTKINTLTPDQKEEEREKIAQDIKKYLAKGGKVTECPPRAFTKVEGYAKKFAGSQFDSLTDPTNRDVGAYRPTKSNI